MDPIPARDEVPETTNVVPMPGSTKTPPQPDQADGKAIAKIDAQAERTALVARLESALTDRYIIKRAPVTVGDVTYRAKPMAMGRSVCRRILGIFSARSSLLALVVPVMPVMAT